MPLDVLDLKRFYATPIGQCAYTRLGRVFAAIWPPEAVSADMRVVALGYGVDYLARLWPHADCAAFMPAAMGVTHWPEAAAGEMSGNRSCLVSDGLPLADNSMDRLLLIHALEFAAAPAVLMAEVWRVLSPGGQVLVCVPNKRGAWVRRSFAPWRAGKSFRPAQIDGLLRQAGFDITARCGALYATPARLAFLQKLNPDKMIEHLGRRSMPNFGGVVVRAGEKRVGAQVKEARQKNFKPTPRPVPALGATPFKGATKQIRPVRQLNYAMPPGGG